MTEFDRVLLYLFALVLGASLPRSAERLRWIARVLLAAIFCICLAGFLSRALPDLVTSAGAGDSRLSFPLTYWNAMGLVAVVGILLSVALASDETEPRGSRILASAATPVLTATLLLTFARGPIVAVLVGLLVLVVVARSSSLVAGLVSTMVPGALAAAAVLVSPAVADGDLVGHSLTQGYELTVAVAGLSLLGAGLRLWTFQVDERLVGLRLPIPSRRHLMLTATGALLALGIGIWLSSGAIGDAYDKFTTGNDVDEVTQSRDRLLQLGNNGRLGHWHVAADAFAESPILGSGAGTYQLLWDRNREDTTFNVQNANSLYLENLAELGIVGFSLLAFVLATMVVAILRCAQGVNRLVGAGLAAAVVAWMIEAGLDWSWEMPAITAWVFFVGGASLARDRHAETTQPTRMTRILISIGVLVVALLPVQVALSQVRLNSSRDSFADGDCGAAEDAALSSIHTFGGRPEPYAILGYCDARLGEDGLSRQTMGKAVDLDPDNWEYHYGLALVRAAGGLDPRSEIITAHTLNPDEALPKIASRAFSAESRRDWERTSLRLELPSG